ncbi:MAG: hypothetical protein ACRENK_11565 [Gemmatimonadaceae bacterium]
MGLAYHCGRYGYRMVTVMFKFEGWAVIENPASRIWRMEGLKVPKKQRPRARLWFADGSSVRLRAE